CAGHLARRRQCSVWAFGGSVDKEGEVLAPEDLDGVEVAVGCCNLPGDHQLRVLEEVEATRVALGEGRDECVAGLAASAADALNVVRLGRWYRSEHHGRQIPDIDAHLQRWRGSEHVRGVG